MARGMDDVVADEPAGGRAVFAERDGEGAQRVERGAGLWARLLCGGRAAGSRFTGRPTVASGRVQLRRIASATATRMVEAGRDLVLLELGDEFLEVLDGHAAGRAAAGDAGEIGGVQAELVHARLHARGQIAGAGGMGGHGQPAARWAPPGPVWRSRASRFRLVTVAGGGFIGHLRGRGAEYRGPARAASSSLDFQIAEHRAHGIALLHFDDQFRDCAAAGAGRRP